MAIVNKSLLALAAGDLMSRDVVVVSEDMPLQDAGHLLAQKQITGAPVIDREGRCVGILSATDFFRWIEDESLDIFPANAVATLMSKDPVTVPPATLIRDLARMMIDGHIHRVIVVDERHRPIGLVSSTDIMAALARTENTPKDRGLRSAP